MVHTTGLAYVTILVADVERSRTFYRDVLGLAELHTSEHFALLSTGNSQLGLHTGAVGDSPSTNLHFQVEDVDMAYDILKGADAVSLPQAPRTMPWGRKAFGFEDPDGYRVELVEADERA